MRISEENENSQRTASDQSAPQSRPQETVRLKFPKAARLKSQQDYRRVLKANQRIQGRFICINFRTGMGECAKLGITVSRKYGKAHERNFFKRLVREAFRESCPFLPQNLELNVMPRLDLSEPTKRGILEDLSQFYAQSSAKKSR